MKALVAVVALLALTACSESEAAPEEQQPQSFDSLVEVRDAAVDSGYYCPGWYQRPSGVTIHDGEVEGGTCGEYDGFTLYPDGQGLEYCARRIASTPEDFRNPLLCGDNWAISANDLSSLEEIAEAMDGTLMGAEYDRSAY